MRQRYDQFTRPYRIGVVLSLFILTLRFYVGPEGTPEFGFPQVRALLDRAAAEYGFDGFLFYAVWVFAILAMVHFVVSLLLAWRNTISVRMFLESAVYSALAVGLLFFHFGYAMAHTQVNLIWALTSGWLITSFLWLVSLLLSSRSNKDESRNGT